MEPLISIIVPVYKVESCLQKCIDSILAQTLTRFELILVNDGSPDKSGDICDQYAQNDARIKVIHQKNKGVSSARNTGIDIATGEYLAFVDPDDAILPEMYEILLNYSLRHDADMVVCQYTQINEADNTEKVPQVWQQTDEAIDNKTIINEILPKFLVNNTFSLVPCFNKLYKKSIFKKHEIKFDESKSFGEDKRLNFTILPLLHTLVFVEKPLYIYFRRADNSLSQVFRDDFYWYLLDDKMFAVNICKQYNLTQYIETVNLLFTTRTLLYAHEVIKQTGISKDHKMEILANIINDNKFKKEIEDYKTNSVYYKVLKYLCIWRKEKYLAKVIQWRNKLRTTW